MTSRNGFVYVFRRADGLRKLGWTTSISRRRSQHHIATGLAHDFEMAWEMGSRSAHKVEQTAHNLLRGLSCAWSREVYGLPLGTIVDAVERAMRHTEAEFPGGLCAYFEPRNSGPRVEIVRPADWEALISEADAYLRDHPELQQQIADYCAAASMRLEYNS